jgi:hypothetical protein
MRPKQLVRAVCHPAFALLAAVVFGLCAAVFVRAADRTADQLAMADDPVKITDQALDRVFNQAVAEREIQSALAAGDTDLARSFLDLAAGRGVPIDATLADQVNRAQAEQSSAVNTAGRFVHGLWTGVPTDLASLAGTAVGDLFVFGDIRDAAREGARYLTGQKADPWILGLAGIGIAITAANYVSLGAETPERVGVSVIKAARRSGRLNPALAERLARDVVKVEDAGGLLELAGDTGRIETKAGTQATLDSLQIAGGPQDVSRLARLAAAKGGKTRAIIKLLGRAAIVLTATAFDLATWLFWAALALLGFVSSCKAAVERATLRYLRWRKAAA